jgi:hypothetical protein
VWTGWVAGWAEVWTGVDGLRELKYVHVEQAWWVDVWTSVYGLGMGFGGLTGINVSSWGIL